MLDAILQGRQSMHWSWVRVATRKCPQNSWRKALQYLLMGVKRELTLQISTKRVPSMKVELRSRFLLRAQKKPAIQWRAFLSFFQSIFLFYLSVDPLKIFLQTVRMLIRPHRCQRRRNDANRRGSSGQLADAAAQPTANQIIPPDVELTSPDPATQCSAKLPPSSSSSCALRVDADR